MLGRTSGVTREDTIKNEYVYNIRSSLIAYLNIISVLDKMRENRLNVL